MSRYLFWLKHPRLLAHRLRYRWWEMRNPDKPWLCPGTVRFCEKVLTTSMTGLEFGSGRSTGWFAQHLRHLTSVEHDPVWHKHVAELMTSKGISNVDYLHIPLDHAESQPEQLLYDPVPAYVRVADRFDDGTLDFVLVDGHYRTHCVRRVISKIRPSGYLIVDDTNLWPSRDQIPLPHHWKVVDDSTNGIKHTIIWQAPSA